MQKSPDQTWSTLVLAAGRGPNDPMAKAWGVANKCLIPVAGVPMVRRVWEALASSGRIGATRISIEDAELLPWPELRAAALPAGASAPQSAIMAITSSGALEYPVLITTGDHALLTPEMVRHFCSGAEAAGADFVAGVARAEVILEAYPQSVRTFFNLGADRISGCNLFAVMNPSGLKLLERWQYLEHVRKKPWRLVGAFGMSALVEFALGRLNLDRALAHVSRRIGLTVRAVCMPFAEAAIDVDKPADKELAETILARREQVA